MPDLVALEQAKIQLRLTGTTEHDEDVTQRVEEATALIVSWLKNYLGDEDERTERYAVIDAWTDVTVPIEVRAAILRLTGHLWEMRGGDDPKLVAQLGHGSLPADVEMFLLRLRDRGMA
jgi:hypothetical protein